MPKYEESVKTLCVNAVKGLNSGTFVKHNGVELKNLTDIKRAYGPNPKAIGRYCKKVGVQLPKKRTIKPKGQDTLVAATTAAAKKGK